MIARRPRETQRAVVERLLRERGEVATYDVLYRMEDAEGRPTSITRLAAIICDLRADGWAITTHEPEGALATYRLVSAPSAAIVWRCLECGDPTTGTLAPALGGMRTGHCLTCHRDRYFAGRAA